MTEPGPESPYSSAQIRTALRWFQVFAWTTGVWLLILTGEVIFHYLVIPSLGGHRPSWAKYIGTVHGWFYFFYLFAAVNLSVKARFAPLRAGVTLLAGTIPFLSFVIERKRTREVLPLISDVNS